MRIKNQGQGQRYGSSAGTTVGETGEGRDGDPLINGRMQVTDVESRVGSRTAGCGRGCHIADADADQD